MLHVHYCTLRKKLPNRLPQFFGRRKTEVLSNILKDSGFPWSFCSSTGCCRLGGIGDAFCFSRDFQVMCWTQVVSAHSTDNHHLRKVFNHWGFNLSLERGGVPKVRNIGLQGKIQLRRIYSNWALAYNFHGMFWVGLGEVGKNNVEKVVL